MTSKILLASTALLALAGCQKSSSAGAIRGRVLAPTGQPAAGARVMLDSASGRTTLTNARGEFRLGGAISGGHKVFALSNHTAALASTHVDGTATADVGDLTLEDCSIIVAQGGAPDANAGGTSGGPAPEGTPGGAPTKVDSDGTIPCEAEPPPPPAPHVDFGAITADYGDAMLDPSGIYGFGWDSVTQVGFDFYLQGDFTAPGTATIHVAGAAIDPTVAPAASMFLYTSEGYAYLLTGGDLTITTAAADGTTPTPDASPVPVATGAPNAGGGTTAPGQPAPGSTMRFAFHAENLTFDYFTWDGVLDPTHTASAASADVAGDAWVWIPPTPPSADITVANFVADWTDLYLCGGCSSTGSDTLYVYAYDSVNGADFSLNVPVSALALPGDAILDASNPEVWASADYYGSAGGPWYYNLAHVTVSTDATSVAGGQALTLNLSNAQFDYVDTSYYTPAAGAGSQQDAPVQFHLFITAGSLSGTVNANTGCANTDPSGTCSGGGTVGPPIAL